jgi:Protein of unknown function (DUF3024)
VGELLSFSNLVHNWRNSGGSEIFVKRDGAQLKIDRLGLTSLSVSVTFSEQQLTHIHSAMADFVQKHRPPEHLRETVDLKWRIEKQSVCIFMQRTAATRTIEDAIAKTTYIRSKDRWKIYWQRADLKWHAYPPHSEALFFDEFLAVVDEDSNCCFWG